jgi:hypothetical protein
LIRTSATPLAIFAKSAKLLPDRKERRIPPGSSAASRAGAAAKVSRFSKVVPAAGPRGRRPPGLSCAGSERVRGASQAAAFLAIWSQIQA